MKTPSPRLTSLALASVLAFAPAGAFADCTAPPDAGACPIKAGPLSFDRCFGSNPLSPSPTTIGNQLCGGVKDVNVLAAGLGGDASKFVQGAERDVNAFVKVVGKDAINQDAISDYNKAAAIVKQIQTDLDAFVRDPQCGSKAAMDALNQFFQAQAENLVAVGQIAGKVAEAAGKIAPVAGEAATAATELGKIAADVAKAGPEAAKQSAALAKALGDLKKDADAVAALDLTGVLADGGALVTTVGPFVTECAGCASAMAGAIGGLGGGTAAAAGGTSACPESVVAAGGSCWVTVAGAGGIGGGLGLGALASGPCGQALEDAGKINDDFTKIQKFVDATVKLSDSIQKSVGDLVTASDALVKLGQELGKNSQPSLDKIEAALNRSIDDVQAAGQTYDAQVAPSVAKLGTSLLQQLADNTDRLMTCYGKLQDIAGRVTGDGASAIADFVAAGALLVDGGQIWSNIYGQSQGGVRAAQNAATTEWTAINGDERRMYADVWGTLPGAPLDFGKAIGALTALATSPSRISSLLNDLGNAGARLVALPGKSLDAGKNAFLNLDTLKPQARSKFDQAGAKSRSALAKFDAARSSSKTRKSAPIRFNGSLVVPKGTTLARPVPKVHLGVLPPTKFK